MQDVQGETTLTAVVRDRPRGVATEERPIGEPGPKEVRIRSAVVGVCHSDLGLIDGHLDDWMGITYPRVFGHEWSGEVVAAGEEVSRVAVGDRVVGCGWMAENHWFGMNSDGALATLFNVEEGLLHKLPESMDFVRGALVEPFACVHEGLRKIGGTEPGELCCVIGAGTIGACAVTALKAMGARVLVIEPDASRRALAGRLGADFLLDPTAVEDLPAAAIEVSGGQAPDLCVESAGAASALASALTLPAKGGRVLFLGLCAQPTVPAPLQMIQQLDLTVTGSTGALPRAWEPAIKFLDASGVDLTPIVTAHFELEEIDLAIKAARDTATNVKVHIDVGGPL